jgi:hypothetical protein
MVMRSQLSSGPFLLEQSCGGWRSSPCATAIEDDCLNAFTASISGGQRAKQTASDNEECSHP